MKLNSMIRYSRISLCGCLVVVGSLLGTASSVAQTQVSTQIVETQYFERTLSLVGNIGPIQDIEISAEANGRVEKIGVKENEQIAQGQLLLNLENDTQQLQVDVAKLNIEAAKNTYDERLATLNDVKRRLDEEELLFQRGSTTKTQLETVRLEYTQREVALTGEKLGIALAEKDLELKRKSFRDTLVYSPIRAVVAESYVDVGEVVNAGQRLFHLIDMSQVEIEVGVAEEDLPLIKKNQKVSFQTPAYPGTTFQGTVKQIAWISDPQTRRFSVKIVASNRKRLLRAGMTAQIQLTRLIKDALIIPAISLIPEGSKQYVFLVKEDRAVKREVFPYLQTPDGVIINKGLKPGDVFVTQRFGVLKHGDPVVATQM